MNSTRTSTRTERRRQRLEDPRFDWTRPLPVRRRLVVAMAALIAAEGVGLGFAFSGPAVARAVVSLAVVLVVAGAVVVCLGALKASVRGVVELGWNGLDERQWQLRGIVYARAYKIGVGLLTALAVAVAVWSIAGFGYPPAAVVAPVLVVTFQVAVVLPTLVAAWHERV